MHHSEIEILSNHQFFKFWVCPNISKELLSTGFIFQAKISSCSGICVQRKRERERERERRGDDYIDPPWEDKGLRA